MLSSTTAVSNIRIVAGFCLFWRPPLGPEFRNRRPPPFRLLPYSLSCSFFGGPSDPNERSRPFPKRRSEPEGRDENGANIIRYVSSCAPPTTNHNEIHVPTRSHQGEHRGSTDHDHKNQHWTAKTQDNRLLSSSVVLATPVSRKYSLFLKYKKNMK